MVGVCTPTLGEPALFQVRRGQSFHLQGALWSTDNNQMGAEHQELAPLGSSVFALYKVVKYSIILQNMDKCTTQKTMSIISFI